MMQFAILEFGFSIGGPEQKKIFRCARRFALSVYQLKMKQRRRKLGADINLETEERVTSVAWDGAAAAQVKAKSPWWLTLRSGSGRSSLREGSRARVCEGSNILIDVRSAEGKLERMPELAGALVNSDVDLILSVDHAEHTRRNRSDENDPHRHDFHRRSGWLGPGA